MLKQTFILTKLSTISQLIFKLVTFVVLDKYSQG